MEAPNMLASINDNQVIVSKKKLERLAKLQEQVQTLAWKLDRLQKEMMD